MVLSRRTVLQTCGASLAAVAGCIVPGEHFGTSDTPEEFVFVAEARDDPEDVGRDWEPLATWIEAETGIPTRIDPVSDAGGAIGALASGRADASYLSGGPAWVGWNQHGFETLAVEADAEGRTSYVAAAYTRADTGIETMEDAAGADSAHTGDLTGAGMLIPVAYLAREGLVSFDADDDVTAIREAVHEYFGEAVIGGGYVGALRVLSAGQADIAFGRSTTPEDYCGGDHAEEWCLDVDAYEIVEEFTEVPSHPVLAGAETSSAMRDTLEEALLALDEDPEGQEILRDVFDVHSLQPARSADHLGTYGELLSNLPGIEDHFLE